MFWITGFCRFSCWNWIVVKTPHSIFQSFSGGSSFPHQRWAPKRLCWSATSSWTASQSFHNRVSCQHRRRTLKVPSFLLIHHRRDQDRLQVQTQTPRTALRSGLFPRCPTRTPLPCPPARFVQACEDLLEDCLLTVWHHDFVCSALVLLEYCCWSLNKVNCFALNCCVKNKFRF